MSDYEHHRGTLTPIREELTPTEFAEIIYDSIPEYYESKLELLQDNEKYYCTKDTVYLVDDTSHNDDSWFQAKKKIDGSIEYDVMYYNGGCGFSEALDEALVTVEDNG